MRRVPRVRRDGRRSAPGRVVEGVSAAVGPRKAVLKLGMGLGGLFSGRGCPAWGAPPGGGMQHPRAPQEPPRRGLRLVPGALGPCWRTCPPACPRGGFLGVAAQPQTCL